MSKIDHVGGHAEVNAQPVPAVGEIDFRHQLVSPDAPLTPALSQR